MQKRIGVILAWALSLVAVGALTHAQALVASQLSRQGKGWFEERLGMKVEYFVYNAGPSAMEAIFTNSIDLTYVGPNPVRISRSPETSGSEPGSAMFDSPILTEITAHMNTNVLVASENLKSPNQPWITAISRKATDVKTKSLSKSIAGLRRRHIEIRLLNTHPTSKGKEPAR